MMVKFSGWVLVFILLLGFKAGEAISRDIPVSPLPLCPGSTVSSQDYYLYEHLKLELRPPQDEKYEIDVAGNYWKIWVTCPGEKEVIKAHYLKIAEGQGSVLSQSGANELDFRYDLPDGPVYVTLHLQSGKHSLKVIRPASLHSQVIFGDGNYAADESGDKNGSPEPPVITDYPESQCTSFTFNDFNKLELSYYVDGKSTNKTVEGRYWQKRVSANDIPGRSDYWISPMDINETMRAAVLAAGGEVLSGNSRELIFHISDPDAGELWATLWPQDGRYSIKIIQEKSMEQVLVFDADAMMAQLNALGVLTLDGIYFDTAKATLKPESDEALQAALKLMTDYPDLVIEVGGHTDSVGKAADNEKLSSERASSVRHWLTEAGIAEPRLEARGYGEESPVADNETTEGKAANRRVELKKLSGGEVIAVMALIKPYPGSDDIGKVDESNQYKLQIYERDGAGKIQERFIIGDGFKQYYQVLDEAGNRDEQLSGIQIRHNYIQAVTDFGGTILAEESHGLYFRLDNLDGSITYASVWAPGSKYQISVVTTPAP